MALILSFPKDATLVPSNLDALLLMGAISREQHWCGVHLRWLNVIDKGDVLPGSTWRHFRKEELRFARSVLFDAGVLVEVFSLCVFDAPWLCFDIERVGSGLTLLGKLWRKNETNAEGSETV